MAELKNLGRAALGAALLAATVLSPLRAAPALSPLASLTYDADVAALLSQLRNHAPKGLLRVDNVQIVDPAKATITSDSTIFVRGARIVWAGRTADAPNVADATPIDGHGRFAVPGLADMHIHSARADGWLLNLAAGVTTVRDMDGFPWILRARSQINAGKMLGPTDYVAGTIIASQPLGEGYAVVAASPEDARRIVRQQAACGYDFVKIHNQLTQPMFDAVASQAHALGMDLVGHVPHNITLDHALHVGGMRTTEHLKGFLIDQTLLPSDEDYGAALADTQTWITPTLYTRRGYDRGDWARLFMASRLPAYAPPSVRASWADQVAHPDTDDVRLGHRFENTQDIVMKRLLPLHPHWLTGTDAEGYTFGLMGFALLDEMHLMRSEGLSAADVLRAATVEAAEAMHESGEFGQIGKGYRADFILLDRNPLEDLSALDRNEGVMANGHWLDRPSLDRAMAQLATIYADGRPLPPFSAGNAASLITRIAKAQSDGFVFDDGAMIHLADALRARHLVKLATKVDQLKAAAPNSFCYVPPPTD